MPELPEVETVRAGLAQHLVGAKVTGLEVLDARSLKKNLGGVQGFKKEVVGATFESVVRRGKFLWLPVSSTRALVGHLGMSGQILVRTPDYAPDPQTRVVIDVVTSSGEDLQIRFVDQRLFGGLMFDDMVLTKDLGPGGYSPEAPTGAQIPTTVAHIARDLLDPLFDDSQVATKMTKKNSGIKRVLLDQGLLSGRRTCWRIRSP